MATSSAAFAAPLAAFVAWCACGQGDDPSAIFADEVVPVLESRCGSPACHGVARNEGASGGTPIAGAFFFEVSGRGEIVDPDAARAAALALVTTVEEPGFSSLLRYPLPVTWGGVPHAGGDNLASPSDPAYRRVVRWIEAESAGGEDAAPLGPLESRFADEVQPLLVGRTCGLTNCHGPSSFVPFRLDPGVPGADGRPAFGAAMTRANHAEVRRFLALDGDAAMSRVLRKALPLDLGGIRHRGGNRSFILDERDSLRRALISMAERERAALVDEPAQVEGVVFVRGPLRAASPFESESFTPGSALMLLSPAEPGGSVTDLTTGTLGGAVDIRDPSVSPDGRSVVFAMRPSLAEARRLYVLALPGGAITPLTDGPGRLPSGTVAADLMPSYGGDGFVYFASNRADVMAERFDHPDLDLYRVPQAGGAVERLTFTPSPEIDPSPFRVGSMHDYLVFSVRRALDDRDETVGFSFPFDRHVDYHIYFGVTPDERLFRQFREMPDGRSVCIVGDPDDVWPFGRLAVVDRNLGPDLPRDEPFDSASLPAYLPTFAPIGAPPGAGSGTALFVDPVPLPDGSLLAARTPEGFDPDDPEALADLALVRVVLEEGPSHCSPVDCAPTAAEVETWVDAPGVADHSPEPVFRRVPSAPAPSALQADRPALFSMVDIVVNDAVMTFLPPAGPRPFRDDVRWVRFVEALPSAPGEVALVPPAQTANGRRTSTTATDGVHMPARVLGEVALEPDNSVFVQVPAEVPFRTQLLDADRMNVGHQHNRWLFVWPGQHFSQSTSRALYDERCGGCHGSASGAAHDVLGQPDVVTQATVTLARYQDRDPRRPRDPVVLGDDTALDVDFVNEVRPILDALCLACHGGEDAAGGLDLSDRPTAWYDTGYESLMARASSGPEVGRYVDERGANARSSYLIEVLTGRELDAPRRLDPSVTAEHTDLPFGQEDLVTLVRWIETGAHYRLPGR